jgi:hypothetical protein
MYRQKNKVSKVITLKALIRLEAAAIGVAFDVASLGLGMIVLARVLRKVKASKVGALWPIVETGEIG